MPAFGNSPRNLVIELPRRIDNSKRIFIGNDVYVGPNSFMTAISQFPPKRAQQYLTKTSCQKFDPLIKIGNRVSFTSNVIISAFNKIEIEDDVMFAANVFMNDGLHGYQNANEPFKYQPIWKIEPILIKQGCWIGQNVVILPGVTIGEYCIIGANSVVNRSIPDRCIAVGAPAKVIKRWNERNAQWFPVSDQ